MLAAFLITARESLEASLLVGMLLAYLTQTGYQAQHRQVWLGTLGAVVLSAFLTVAIVFTIGHLDGFAQEFFEGTLMLLAAGILTYVLLWMRQRGRDVNRTLRSDITAATTGGAAGAITLLSFLAVFREGLETALYLATIAVRGPATGVWAGAIMGVAMAVGVGNAVYRGSQVFKPRLFFQVSSAVLLVFGAGLVAQATVTFQALGVFPGTIALWDTSALLPDSSTLGGILHTLVGYAATPSLLQVILWASYVALVLALFFDLGNRGAATLYGEPFRPIGTSYQGWLYRLLRRPRLTTVLPGVMGVVFVSLLVVALLEIGVGSFDNQGPLRLGSFQNPEVENNLFNWVLWVIWLPLLSLGTALVGRVWCGNLCPLRLVTEGARGLADRVLGRGSVATPYLRLGWLLPTSFILITFVVKLWPVQAVARYGALLFLVTMALAALVGFFFRQGTWCRYVCPVGGWLARIARLSPLGLRADTAACASCAAVPCVTGTALAGRCPVLLNPSRLESNRNCLKCWQCVINCPEEKSSLRLGWRFPGAELLKPYAPDLWESLFVASLLGMYIATGHRSETLAALPWPLVFFGLIAMATVAYLGFSGSITLAGGVPFRQTVATFGYIFLPLEFSTAIITFGDEALEFFGVTEMAASLLLGVGFVWSMLVAVAIVRNACHSQVRRLAAAVPVGIALLGVLFLWLSWYASGTVVDLT